MNAKNLGPQARVGRGGAVARPRLATLGLALLAAGPAWAESEPFNPDRPTFADNPLTVPAGSFMLELGLEVDFADPPVKPIVGGTVRLGVASDLEVRVGLPTLLRTDIGDTSELDLSDMSLGAKYHLPVAAIDLGLVLTVGVPTATGLFDDGAVEASLSLNASKGVGGGFGVGGNVGATLTGLGADETGQVVFGSGLATYAVNEALSLVGQVFALQPVDGDLALGVGPAMYGSLASGVQVDFGLNFGVVGGLPDVLLRSGASIQF